MSAEAIHTKWLVFNNAAIYWRTGLRMVIGSPGGAARSVRATDLDQQRVCELAVSSFG
jgi:hypothetical protein